MNPQHKLSKRISSAFVASLMILLVISTQITVLPVIFTHSVIKLSGISDFKIHSYIIKTSEYPEEFFSNAVWGKLLCAGCFYVYDKPVYSPLSQGYYKVLSGKLEVRPA